MVFYTSLWACAIITVIVALHVLIPFLNKLLASILSSVNICLHLLLIAVLFIVGAGLEELVLLLMTSLLIYLLTAYIIGRRRAEKEDMK